MTSDDVSLSPAPGEDLRTQYGALCWRVMQRKIEVLLVTSRETGRWVIPKGWPIRGLSPGESAAREAFEEAGVDGRVGATCIGSFSYDKVLGKPGGPRESVPCVVAVYPLRVERLRMVYPERDQRRRKWFSPENAARKVAEPELKQLLAHAAQHVAAAGAGPKA